MWAKLGKGTEYCALYRGGLEELRPGVDAVTAQDQLRAVLPAGVIAHAQDCESCMEAAEVFWASRVLLAEGIVGGHENVEEMTPWFTTRVMARIAEREAESRQSVLEWRGTVSRVASKLALASAGALLVAGTWAYDVNGHVTTNANRGNLQAKQAVGAESPYLFDPGPVTPNLDDALVSPAER
jgi:hypothetical protein